MKSKIIHILIMMLLSATLFTGSIQSTHVINNKELTILNHKSSLSNNDGDEGFYNWSDGGIDSFELTTAFVLFDIPILQVKDKRIVMIGSTDVVRSTPEEIDNGYWKIDVEIISMELHGLFNWMWLEESSERDSTGSITQEIPGIDFPAECSFGVYIEIHTLLPPPFDVMYNTEPVNMASTIYDIPPYLSEYDSEESMEPIPLYTLSGKYANEPIGFITEADHDLPPEPSDPECECDVSIIKPENKLYLNDRTLFQTKIPIIFGAVTIDTVVTSLCNISMVEFYIDGIKMATDYSPPYNWKWTQASTFKQHLITIYAYSNGKICGWKDVIVLKIF